MEELEFLWSVVHVIPAHTGIARFDLFSNIGDEELDLVTSFSHYPSEEEVVAALAMWKAGQQDG